MKKPRCVLCAYAIAAGAIAGPVDGRPVVPDDILRSESIGQVVFDPSGRWLVFERYRRYGKTPNFAVSTYYAGWGRADLTLVDVRQRRALDPPALRGLHGYQVGAFSPTGRNLSLLWIDENRARVGAFDLLRNRLVSFNLTPNVVESETTAVWVSDDDLIVSVLPDDEQPYDMMGRQWIAERYWQLWRDQASGTVSSVDVLVSGRESKRELSGTLVKASVANGQHESLALGRFTDLALSPQKKWVSALKRYVGTTAWSGELTLIATTGDSSATITVCPACNVPSGTTVWSPDGRTVSFYADESTPNRESGLYTFDVDSGRLDRLQTVGFELASERERGLRRRPERTAWIDNNVVAFGREVIESEQTRRRSLYDLSDFPGKRTRPDWFLLRRDGTRTNLTRDLNNVSPVLLGASSSELLILADGAVWRVNERGAKRVPAMTDKRWESPWDAKSIQRRDLLTPVFLVGDSPSRMLRISPKSQDQLYFSASSDGEVIVKAADTGEAFVTRRFEREGESFFLNAPGSRMPLGTLNSHLTAATTPVSRSLTYRGPSGESLRGCVMFPPNYDSTIRHALIIDVYPGLMPSGCDEAAKPVNLHSINAIHPQSTVFLAAEGYVVLQPDARTELIRDDRGPLANLGPVVDAAVNEAIRSASADPERIGLWGFSQGGVTALTLLAQSKRYKAAVVGHSWSNMISHFGSASLPTTVMERDWGFLGDTVRYTRPGSQFHLGGPPWQFPDRYVAASPLFMSPSIETPVLMIQGDMDPHFPMGQLEEMYNALDQLGREAQLVRYFGEGHAVSSPANILDMWARIFAWYDMHLGPGVEEVASPQH